MGLTQAQESYLAKYYYDSKNAGSYSGPEKLFKGVENAGNFNISLHNIRKWLEGQEVYTTSRVAHKNFNRNSVEVAGVDDIWDADLIDFSAYSSVNNEYKYVLICIDIFSRYVWSRNLKSKYGLEISKNFLSIINQASRKPNAMRTDGGREFSNKTVDKLYKSEHIKHYSSNNQLQSNYAERVIKTLKSRLTRMMSKKLIKRWVDDFPSIVASYNKTYHSSIGMSPENVNHSNEREVRYDQYLLKGKRLNPTFKRTVEKGPLFKIKPFKFKIGQSVRISITRSKMDRFYNEYWTPEIYTVIRRFRREGLNIYKVEDKLNEQLDGTFYGGELQKVVYDPEGMYRIEKVIKKRVKDKVKQSLIRWYGWPRKFDSWLNDNVLQNFDLVNHLEQEREIQRVENLRKEQNKEGSAKDG